MDKDVGAEDKHVYKDKIHHTLYILWHIIHGKIFPQEICSLYQPVVKYKIRNI